MSIEEKLIVLEEKIDLLLEKIQLLEARTYELIIVQRGIKKGEPIMILPKRK
jgi:hypothetical protein